MAPPDPAGRTGDPAGAAQDGKAVADDVILLAEELLRVGRKAVETGRVVVRTTIATRDEVVDAPRIRRDLSVERVAVDRVVETAPPVRQEEDGTVVVPVLEEVLFVEKRLVLREEIRIRRSEQVLPHQETVRLRREEATVERRAPDPINQAEGYETMAMTPTGTGSSDPYDSHLTAMFDTYQQARQARDELVAEGIASNQVDIIDNNAEATDASFAYERNEPGIWGAIKRFFVPEEDAHHYAEGVSRGHAMLVVRPAPGMHDRAVEVIERFQPIDYDSRTNEWRDAGWTGQHAGQAAYDRQYASGLDTAATTATAGTTATGMTTGTTATGAGLAAGRDEVIPIVEEQLRLGKRDVTRGTVRVRSYVVTRPVEEQISLRDETVDVERRAVNRPVTDADDVFRERVIEATETDEEAVVGKEAVVREEITIRKGVTERTETVRDELRRTEVEVQDDRKAGLAGGTTDTVDPALKR